MLYIYLYIYIVGLTTGIICRSWKKMCLLLDERNEIRWLGRGHHHATDPACHCQPLPRWSTATKSDCSLTKNPIQTEMVIQVKLQDAISKKRSCPNLWGFIPSSSNIYIYIFAESQSTVGWLDRYKVLHSTIDPVILQRLRWSLPHSSTFFEEFSKRYHLHILTLGEMAN